MTCTSRYVLAFAIVAMSVGAWLYWRGGSEQPQVGGVDPGSPAKGTTTVISSDQPGAVESVVVRASEVAEEGDAVEADSSKTSQVDRKGTTALPANGELHPHANSQSAPAEMDGLSVPEGAPFPIAELIEKECASGNDLDWDCAEVQWVLKRIEDEARDTQWASSMESRIRAVVGAAPGVNIRALACRATVCVVETDGALLLPDVWKPLHTDLLGAGYVRAYEHTGIAERNFRVELWTFKRRR